MSRTVSLDMLAAMNAQETGEVFVALFTVTHPDLDAPILLSTDNATRLSVEPLLYGTVSRGNTYLFLPMSVVLPDDKDEAPPQAQIIIENVSRDLIPLLRSTDTPASITMECVLASTPDIVEITFPALDVVSVSYDALRITLTLQTEALLTEPYPAGTFSPSDFPALFG